MFQDTHTHLCEYPTHTDLESFSPPCSMPLTYPGLRAPAGSASPCAPSRPLAGPGGASGGPPSSRAAPPWQKRGLEVQPSGHRQLLARGSHRIRSLAELRLLCPEQIVAPPAPGRCRRKSSPGVPSPARSAHCRGDSLPKTFARELHLPVLRSMVHTALCSKQTFQHLSTCLLLLTTFLFVSRRPLCPLCRCSLLWLCEQPSRPPPQTPDLSGGQQSRNTGVSASTHDLEA